MASTHSEHGPWGETLHDELERGDRLGAAFSQFAWEAAKQEGCLNDPTARRLPSWPPKRGGFMYPELQNEPEAILGQGAGACGTPPFMTEASSVGAAPSRKQVRCVPLRHDRRNGGPPDGGSPKPWQDDAAACPVGRPSSPCVDARPAGAGKRIAETIRATELDFSNVIEATRPTHANAPPMRYADPSPPSPHVDSARIAPYVDSPYQRVQADACALRSGHLPAALFPCMANTISGIVYDLQHWDRLPSNETLLGRLSYVFGRDDRPIYLGVLMVIASALLILVAWIFAKAAGSHPRLQAPIASPPVAYGPPSLYACPYPYVPMVAPPAYAMHNPMMVPGAGQFLSQASVVPTNAATGRARSWRR